MAREAETGRKGYLHRCLADGARAFHYRSRIRALLGLPRSGGVEMNLSKPLPIAGFAYVVPRFTGEFELPDELFAGASHRITHAEEPTLSAEPAVVAPSAKDRAWGARESDRQAAGRAGELNQLPTNKQTADRPEFPGVPVGEITTMEPGPPQSRSKTTQPQTRTGGSRPAHKAHDEIVPDVRRDAVPSSIGRKVEDADRPPPASFLPLSVTGPADSTARDSTAMERSSIAGRSPLTKDAAANLPEQVSVVAKPSAAVAGGTIPRRPLPESKVGSPGAVEAQFREGRQRSSAPAGPLVAKSRPPHWGKDTVPLAGSFPSARRPQEPNVSGGRKSSEIRQQPSPNAAVPAAQPAQPQVVVVKQGSDPGTPVAFWERRYLNQLRVRVRR